MIRVLPVLLALGCIHHPELRAIPETAAVHLPADHKPHRDAQTEWWHVHAELEDTISGEPVYVFAGFIVQRTGLDGVGPLSAKTFVDPLQLALVKVQIGDKVWVADRTNFPDIPAAGVSPEGTDIHHGNWRMTKEQDTWIAKFGAGPHRFEIRLNPTRAATLPGNKGLVELRPGSRHLWVQQEAMAVEGSWKDGGRARNVKGVGFVKHQWGRLYDPDLDGFEWISADLPGGRSLSIAWLKDGDERGVPGSMAWYSTPEGETVQIDPETLSIEVTERWKSKRSGNDWPIAWQISGPELSLDVGALRANQELWVFPAALYAGPAQATGTAFGEAVNTVIFVEQVGGRPYPLRTFMRSRAPTLTGGGS